MNRQGASLDDITHRSRDQQWGKGRRRAESNGGAHCEVLLRLQEGFWGGFHRNPVRRTPALRIFVYDDRLIRERASNLPRAIYEHTRYLIAPQFIPRTTVFRANSIRADPVEQHGMSPIPKAVSHTDMLSFAPRRLKDQSFRRSSLPTKISDITALS
ncbi:hypothetical protein C8R48DRAFT_774536 [Suillus tomentosus]|nr:hypothetical protein C8R48DRAFT_774536 [Suillus tomentosus]